MKYSAILALASVAVVAAQAPGTDSGRLYYSEPVSATVWTAGKTQTVSWTNVCKPENTGDLNIVLYTGVGGTNQVRVPGIPAIGKLNCLKSKTATITLPANLTTGNVYAIYVETVPLQSYSSHFTIKGIDPVTSAPAATTVAATPTSAAATSAAAVSTGASATGSNSPDASGKPTGNGAGSLKVVGSSAVVVLAAIAMMF